MQVLKLKVPWKVSGVGVNTLLMSCLLLLIVVLVKLLAVYLLLI